MCSHECTGHTVTLIHIREAVVAAKAVAVHDSLHQMADVEEADLILKEELDGLLVGTVDGTAETEAKIKEETQATIRCVPFMFEQTPGVDMVSGKPATQRVIIARSY